MSECNPGAESHSKPCRKCRKLLPLSEFPFKAGTLTRISACDGCAKKDRATHHQKRQEEKENKRLDTPAEEPRPQRRTVEGVLAPVEARWTRLLAELSASAKSGDGVSLAYVVALPEHMVWDEEDLEDDEAGARLRVLRSEKLRAHAVAGAIRTAYGFRFK